MTQVGTTWSMSEACPCARTPNTGRERWRFNAVELGLMKADEDPDRARVLVG